MRRLDDEYNNDDEDEDGGKPEADTKARAESYVTRSHSIKLTASLNLL